jgi:hypothetical protein
MTNGSAGPGCPIAIKIFYKNVFMLFLCPLETKKVTNTTSTFVGVGNNDLKAS